MRSYSLLLLAVSCDATEFWASRRISVPCEKVRPAAERYLASRGLTLQKTPANSDLVFYGKYFKDGKGRRMPNTLMALERYAQELQLPKAQGAVWLSYAHADLTSKLRLEAAPTGCIAKLAHLYGYHGIVWAAVFPVDGDWSSVDANGLLEAEYLTGIAKEAGAPQSKPGGAKPAIGVEASSNNSESHWSVVELRGRIAKSRTATLPDASHPEKLRVTLRAETVRSSVPKWEEMSFALSLWHDGLEVATASCVCPNAKRESCIDSLLRLVTEACRRIPWA
jgi:hypothetical protein